MTDHYQTTRITHPDHPGWAFLVKRHYDHSLAAPWEEHDCHGEVAMRDASRHDFRHGTGKAAGEVVIHEDRGTVWCYDYAGAMKRAKRDGWGLTPEQDKAERVRLYMQGMSAGQRNLFTMSEIVARADCTVLTPGQKRRAAVDADMKRMRGWAQSDWYWCWIRVEACEAPEGIDVDALDYQTLGGLESDGKDYIQECARDMAAEIAGPAVEAKAEADAAKVVADAELAALRLDAERYRKLRAMHWTDNELAVLLHPQDNAAPGSVTFHGRTLDTVLDGYPEAEGETTC